MSEPLVTDPEVISRLLREGPIAVSRAAQLLPPVRGKRRHSATLVRWIVEGKKGVRLEGYHLDSTWWTSEPALARFLAALTATEANGTVSQKPSKDWLEQAARMRDKVLERLRPRGGTRKARGKDGEKR